MVRKQGMELADDDDDGISIKRVHQAGGRAIIQGILWVNQYSSVCFFLVTWLHAVAVLLPITVIPDVMKICLPSVQPDNASLLERNVKCSCLFIGSRRKSGQFLGTLYRSATFLRMPLPRFSLVDSLMLLMM